MGRELKGQSKRVKGGQEREIRKGRTESRRNGWGKK